jgi:hypothetical protein
VEQVMRYVCDAPGQKTWFEIETEAEAGLESQAMQHAVEKHFRQAQADAVRSYVPPPGPFVEQNIGLKAHVRRVMPVFLTLRDADGAALATAMLPADPRQPRAVTPIVVGPGNGDPYPAHADAIAKLGAHFGVGLERARCYPYARR